MFASISAKLESLMNLKEMVDGIKAPIQVRFNKYHGLLKRSGKQNNTEKLKKNNA